MRCRSYRSTAFENELTEHLCTQLMNRSVPGRFLVLSYLTGDGGLDKVRGVARKLGVEHPGVIYHVMSRGDRREAIF